MSATTIELHPAPSRALGYQFTPLPVALVEDRRLGHLIDRDLIVASEMVAIGQLGGRADSCWCTKAVIAERLGISQRTVQASWARLRARGWIFERIVGPLDPEDPRNHTGRRYLFGWVVGPEDQSRPGEKDVAPGGEKPLAPKRRITRISEKMTKTPVVVLSEAANGDAEPVKHHPPDGRADTINPPTSPEALPLPAPLAEAIASPAIGEPLRRQIGRMVPGWLKVHPAERVAAALMAMIEAARHRRVKSPIGYLVGTLRNMEAEGDGPSELAPPPVLTRTPDADRTAERLAEIRRGEFQASERERRWAALPEVERRAIKSLVDAECSRPSGMPERLWALSRHASCLDRMDLSHPMARPG